MLHCLFTTRRCILQTLKCKSERWQRFSSHLSALQVEETHRITIVLCTALHAAATAVPASPISLFARWTFIERLPHGAWNFTNLAAHIGMRSARPGEIARCSRFHERARNWEGPVRMTLALFPASCGDILSGVSRCESDEYDLRKLLFYNRSSASFLQVISRHIILIGLLYIETH